MNTQVNWLRLVINLVGLIANVKLALMTRDDMTEIRQLAPDEPELAMLAGMNFRTEALRTGTFATLLALSVIHLIEQENRHYRAPGIMVALRVILVLTMVAIPLNELLGRRRVMELLRD